MIYGTKSTSRQVASGVPQGLIVGSILFNIFINELETETEHTLSKFTDDRGVADTPDGCAVILRRTSTSCRNGLRGILSSLARENAEKSCIWGGITPGTYRHWGRTSWKAALLRRTLASWWMTSCPCRLMQTCSKEGQVYLGLCYEKHHQQVKKGGPFPLLSTGETSSRVLGPVLGSTVEERHGHTGESPAH